MARSERAVGIDKKEKKASGPASPSQGRSPRVFRARPPKGSSPRSVGVVAFFLQRVPFRPLTELQSWLVGLRCPGMLSNG